MIKWMWVIWEFYKDMANKLFSWVANIWEIWLYKFENSDDWRMLKWLHK
jgi:hypothetical protein